MDRSPGRPLAQRARRGVRTQPLIGYVGLTSDWTDFTLLRKLGERFPGQIVMVGPIHPKVVLRCPACIGAKGGQAKSPKKTRAARRNATRRR